MNATSFRDADTVASRFRRMLDMGRRESSSLPTRASIHVVGGLHAGAHLSIDRSPLVIGRSLRADIVLRDIGIATEHARIEFEGGRWLIREANTNELLPAIEHRYRGRFVRERLDLGHARLVLSQPATESVKAPYEKQPAYRPLIAALVLGAFVSVGLVFAKMQQSFQPGPAPEVAAARPPDLSAWPDVQLAQGADGSARVSGFVRTTQDRQAVLAALSGAPGHDAALLRSGEHLAKQIQEVLDSPSLSVRYVGNGVIRLTGQVSDAAEYERLQWVIEEYAGVAEIDNLTEYEPPPHQPQRRPLPFRIVDVIPGPDGSFGDDNGNRFFVGARLPDGSTLVAVHNDAVEFVLNDEPLVYPLK